MEAKKKQNRGKSGSAMPMSHLDICDRMKLVRLEKKLTQHDFAFALDLTESYIKMIEVRAFTPNIYAIKQLHKVFGISYDWLLEGQGTKK